MTSRASLGPHKLSLPQIALILVVGLLAIVTVVLALQTYFSSNRTATAFKEAGFTTTNLSNIQRETLLLRIETHALFTDFTKGFEAIEYPGRDFKPVELRRDFLAAQLRVAAAQVSNNAEARADLEQMDITLAAYDGLLDRVRANPTIDRLAGIAQSDDILIQLERQVKVLYDRQEVLFFQATSDALGSQKSAQTLLFVISAIMLALALVLAISLRQSVGTAFKRAYGALQTEVKERRRLEEKAVVDDVARIITSTLNIEEVYERFAAEVKKLVDFDRMSINIFDRHAGVYTMKHTIGLEVSGHRTGDTWSLDGTQSQVVLTTGQTLFRSDISDHQYSADQEYLDVDLRSMILLPLIYQGTVLGCIALRSMRTGAYGPKEQVILERLANQIAPAVGNAQLFEQSKHAEEAMRVSEEKYRTLVNESPDMIFVSRIDDWRITEVNDRACEYYGYSLQEFLTMNVFDIEIEPPLPEHIRSLYASTPEGQVLEVYGTNKRKDGTTFPVHVRFAKLNDVLVIANVRDITERQVAEEAEHRWAIETSVMAEIGRIINSSLNINEVYDRLGEEIRKLIPFDRFSVGLVDSRRGTMSPAWIIGLDVLGRRDGEEISLAGSIAGEVFHTRSSIMLEAETEADIDRFPLLMPHYNAGLRSFMAVALSNNDSVVGVLRVGSKNRRIYNQRHLELLERIGSQIAGAIANSLIHSERQLALQETRTLAELGRIVSSSLDVGEIYERFAQEVQELIQFDRLSFTTVDRGSETVTVVMVAGFTYQEVEVGTQVPMKGSLTFDVLANHSPTLLQGATKEHIATRYPSLLPGFRLGARSWLSVPLINRDEVIGSLNIISKMPHAYTQNDVAKVERIGYQIAGAMANARLYSERQLALQETRTLAELGRIISSSVDVGEIYERFAQEVQELIPFDRMSFTTIDHRRETATVVMIAGFAYKEIEVGSSVPMSGSLTFEVFTNRSPTLLQETTEDQIAAQYSSLLPGFRQGARSWLAVPLINRDEVIGALIIISKTPNAYTEQDVAKVERIGSQVAGAMANARLYSEREKAEKAIQAEKERYSDLVDTIPQGIEETDATGTILFANAAHHKQYGYAKGELVGKSIFDLIATNSEREQVRDYLKYFVDEQPTFTTLFGQRITKAGKVIDVQVDWNYNRIGGEVVGFTSVISDISERKQAEDRIKASLAEKEVLLKEINHRVKNNLQIISSLLHLQSRDIHDEQALRSFQVSQDRIRAMALVHEKLYLSEDLARIDFGEYIESLASDLRSSYGLGSQHVKLKIDVDNILLGVDTAIPCGVIVNELVANSLKHAFPGDRSGEIAISFREVDGHYSMIFKDDGVGLPEGLDISHPSSLGLTIVNAVTGQLGGTIALSRNGGSEISITFPVTG